MICTPYLHIGEKEKMRKNISITELSDASEYEESVNELQRQMDTICKKFGISKAEAIRNAIDFYYNYVKGLKVIELRDVSKEQAEKEILDYVKEKGKAWTDEIADDLRIDIVLVNEILKGLAEKGVVE